MRWAWRPRLCTKRFTGFVVLCLSGCFRLQRAYWTRPTPSPQWTTRTARSSFQLCPKATCPSVRCRTVAAVEAPSTRSRIETVDQTAKVLTELAGRLRSGAPMLERAANVYTQQMRAPNGNAWQGDAADSFDAAAQADHLTVVIPVIERAQLLADVSEHGSENLLGAQQMALQAIAEAESDAFTVGEDLSVNDNFLWRSAADQEARQQAAVAYRNYIAHWAARIDAESTRVVAKLRAGAAEMAALTPAHWRQPLTQSLSAGVRNPAAAQPLAPRPPRRRSTGPYPSRLATASRIRAFSPWARAASRNRPVLRHCQCGTPRCTSNRGSAAAGQESRSKDAPDTGRNSSTLRAIDGEWEADPIGHLPG